VPDAADPRPADPTPDAPEPAPVPAPVPTEAELAEVAEPAQVRRAPRFGAFIVAGALVGIVIGLVAALVAGGSSDVVSDGTAFISLLEGQGAVRFIAVLTGAVVGGFAGAGAALLADRRSVRRAGGDPRR
jgi:hypothetical protein